MRKMLLINTGAQLSSHKAEPPPPLQTPALASTDFAHDQDQA
jgi:hypothetical protein